MVYIDNAQIPYGRMLMSHMIADTEHELLAMCKKINLDHRHYQKESSTPHFDVSKAYREKAIKEGAISIEDKRKFVKKLKEIRRGQEDGTFYTKPKPEPKKMTFGGGNDLTGHPDLQEDDLNE